MADVASGGGGGAPSGDAGGGGGAPAAPARGRIGDLSGIGLPSSEPAQQPQQRSEPQRPARIPGDEGVMPLEEEAAAQTEEPSSLFDSDPLVTDAQTEEEPQLDDQAPGDDAPLYGLPPADVLALLREGKLPPEFEAQHVRTLTIDGQQVQMTLPELDRAAMRGVDYSRKTRQLADTKRQYDDVIQQDAQRWEQWKNPERLYDDLSARGLITIDDIINESGPVYEIARHIAQTRRAYMAMTPGEQSAFIREQAAERRAAELEHRERQLQDRDRQIQHGQLRDKHARALQQLVPQAFAKAKLQDSPLAQNVFKSRLSEIVNGLERFQGLTPEIVDEAARQTVDTLRELARYGTPGAPAQPQRGAPPRPPQQRAGGGPLPPTALPGGRNGNGAPQQRGPFRGRIGDLSPLRKR